VEDEDEFEGFELSDLKTITTLGIGGFGRVNLVRHIDRDKVYALKILNKQHVKNKNQASFERENSRKISSDALFRAITFLFLNRSR